jgi:nicotinamide/nicotinate riboside kinase
MVDWDCVESLSIPDMLKSLEHIHQDGTFPVSFLPSSIPFPLRLLAFSHTHTSHQPILDSKEDQNSIGACPVPTTLIDAQRSLVSSFSATQALLPRICFLDGFLLYPPSMSSIQAQLDIKMFLRTTKAKALARRAARSGYVTLEGFWEDPPDYVEKIVWPNYVRDHAFLFREGDVEGVVDEEVARERGIEHMSEGKEGDADMSRVLEWAVGVLLRELPKLAKDIHDGVGS